jgi:hypothetical protein
MIAPLLSAAALDYTAEGGWPPSALPPKSKTIYRIRNEERQEDRIRTSQTLTRHAGRPRGNHFEKPGGK